MSELVNTGILILAILVLVLVLFYPIYMVHVLVVEENTEWFKTLFTVYYWAIRIVGVILGLLLILASIISSEGAGIRFVAFILGVMYLWMYWIIYPHYYDLVVNMVDNTLQEPVPLAVVKLVFIFGLQILLSDITLRVREETE